MNTFTLPYDEKTLRKIAAQLTPSPTSAVKIRQKSPSSPSHVQAGMLGGRPKPQAPRTGGLPVFPALNAQPGQ